MVAARKHDNHVVGNAINDAVFVVNAPRPAAGKLVFKRFRLANPFKWSALHGDEKRENTLYHLGLTQPCLQIFHSLGFEVKATHLLVLSDVEKDVLLWLHQIQQILQTPQVWSIQEV